MPPLFSIASVSIQADSVFGAALPWFTNSMLVTLLVTFIIALLVRLATRNLSMVPGGGQNFLELLVETLYENVETLVGKSLAPRAFSLLGTIFIFILVSNWFGLLPGVGSIGFGEASPHGVEVHTPLIRPATADLNMNLAIALFFMLMWLVWTIQEVGIGGFIAHTFAPKGGLKGFMLYALAPIFFFVGIIELISIAFRPVSLSLRLFGNIFAGETLLHTMSTLGETLGLPGWLSFITSVIFPLPFYFLEILVGLLQAGVFMLLCTVYLLLSTQHDEEEHSH